MTDNVRKSLRAILIERYDELAQRLARKLGSKDQAENALHNAWLRLAAEGGAEPAGVRSPRAYLLRIALNEAATAKRSEPKWLTYDERIAFLDRLDDQPGPEAIALGKSEMAFVRRAIEELPPRRRAMFEAAWLDQTPQKEIAAQHNLSVRMVQIELRHAMRHILDRIAETNIIDFASSPRNASDSQEGGSPDVSTPRRKE